MPMTRGEGGARTVRGLLLRPASWPIALKLSLTLLLVALGPMVMIAAINLGGGIASLEAAENENLELLATSTAGRLDQLLVDSSRVVAQVAGDTEVEGFLGASREERSGTRASVERTLQNVVGSNPDVASVFLLDAGGLCIAATNQEQIAQSFAFREYYQKTLEGQPFISEILSGNTTRQLGVYLSQPILEGIPTKLRGVAVLKLKASAIDKLIGALRVGQGGRAMLVDAYGVVVSYPDPSVSYRSLALLPPATRALPVFQQRFSSIGIEEVADLGLPDLARTLALARAPGSVGFVAPWTGARQAAGFAPLATKPWVVLVHEPEEEFKAPLRALARRSALSVLLVGAAVTLLALLIARNIVRPLRGLMRASQAVQRGDYEALALPEVDDDEIGMLTRSFQTMVAGLRERERERDIFGRVVSPEVREKLLGGALALGGETRHVAVLFSDIRGFSTISEQLPPLAVVAMLNEYLTAMTAAVAPFGGYVNNFIGDAIVVVFGAPVESGEVELRAVRAALGMQTSLAQLNERRVARGDDPIATGIGISAGTAVAGQIGSLERMLYTVIGDVVNVAARLESMTKDLGHPILVTRLVADTIGSDARFRRLSLGPVKVKGRSEAVEVFAVERAASDRTTGDRTAGDRTTSEHTMIDPTATTA
jgi:class 3 adenylate cyclase